MKTKYQYQHIVDQSNQITIIRRLDKRALKDLSLKLEQLANLPDSDIKWSYSCVGPRVFRQGNSNAPSYIPDKPTLDDLAKWIAFQGVQSVLEDSYNAAVVRSRIHDKECRSSNFEKFDEETFIRKQTWCNDNCTKADLEKLRENLIESMSKGHLPDGTPINGPEDYAKAYAIFKDLNERISAKSRL